MEELKQQLLAYHCPRWDELPDLELYVDQVVSYVERHTGILDINHEGNLITSSMINNYVKMKLIPPPVKRKYNRRHLARLMVICTLKRDFSISELHDMTEITLLRYDRHEAYDFFCEELERSIARVFHQKVAPIEVEITQEYETIQAVMTAFANRVYAQCVLHTYLKRKKLEEEAVAAVEAKAQETRKKHE